VRAALWITSFQAVEALFDFANFYHEPVIQTRQPILQSRYAEFGKGASFRKTIQDLVVVHMPIMSPRRYDRFTGR